VRIYKAGADEPSQTWPQTVALTALPGMSEAPKRRGWMAGLGLGRKTTP
jgi:hypothetical protein